MLMAKIWKIKPSLSSDLIEQLLLNRGFKTAEQRNLFFNSSLSDFAKDLEISGISKAQDRIKKAIKNSELIVVYGDYDVDGICASTILYKALTSIGAKVLPYIPHREKEGYGLSKVGLEFARDSRAAVVITVDNGIVAFEQALYAKSLGLDLIITDHHLPLDKLPEAFAIVHSIKMCGAAVAWCLIKDMVSKKLTQELLQFVGIATVCDLIPLTGLGRSFLKFGLEVLNKTTNVGLKALLSETQLDNKILTSFEIGYILGPRLNAIGRLEHAIDAVRLLCTQDPVKARRLAKLLCDTNNIRQKMTIEAVEEARLKIDDKKRIHILYSETWAPGIIGLVAGRVAEEYNRPAIAISVREKISKGSARSIDGINIADTLRQCADILVDVGGHEGAAGFSITNENIPVFLERMEKIALDFPKDIKPELHIEAVVPAEALTKKLIQDLEKFEPFGFGNPKPIFATTGMKIADIRTVGEGKHLKFKVYPSVIPSGAQRNEGSIDCIAFGMGEWEKLLKSGQLIDVAYNLELNVYNGSEKVQLKVKDIKVS